MIIYCIRHGETNSNLKGIVSGRSDEPLNQKGVEQAQEINNRLSDITFRAVYVSPMKRTLQTAEIIIPEKQFIIDERLAERDLASLKNHTIDELWNIPTWNSLQEMRTPEGAETFGSGQVRVRDFLLELKKKYQPNDKILLITHSFISRCLWAIESNITKEQNFSKFSHRNNEIKIYKY